MRRTQKRNKKNLLRFWLLFFFLSLTIFLLFSIKINIIFDNKEIKKIPIILFPLEKYFLVQKIFQEEKNIIKLKIEFNFKTKSVLLKKEIEKPVALICYQKCYYLGEHSYIYDIQNERGNKILGQYIKIFSALPIYPDSYLETNLVNAFLKIFEYSHLKPLVLKRIFILNNLDLKIETENFIILIDPYKNIDGQIKKLDYFLDNQNYRFSQIDLRIPGKIYFK